MEWFKKNIPGIFVPEIQDIHVVERSPGVMEYTSVIYDFFQTMICIKAIRDKSFESSDENFFHPGKFLVIRTRVASDSFDDMTDSVMRDSLDYEEIMVTMVKFRNELGSKIPRNAVPVIFPPIRAILDENSSARMMRHTYTCSDHVVLNESFPMDLLTRRMKYRTFFRSTEETDMAKEFRLVPNLAERALIERPFFMMKNRMGFCLHCKEITRMFCSKCKQHYSCGSYRCHDTAWKVHKSDCK